MRWVSDSSVVRKARAPYRRSISSSGVASTKSSASADSLTSWPASEPICWPSGGSSRSPYSAVTRSRVLGTSVASESSAKATSERTRFSRGWIGTLLPRLDPARSLELGRHQLINHHQGDVICRLALHHVVHVARGHLEELVHFLLELLRQPSKHLTAHGVHSRTFREPATRCRLTQINRPRGPRPRYPPRGSRRARTLWRATAHRRAGCARPS